MHAIGNTLAIGLYAASWHSRRRGSARGRMLAGAGLATVTATGWLGGHLTYARGVGVDTTAFDVAPTNWSDVLHEDELTQNTPRVVHADGIAVMLLRLGGTVHALADRCTHRGAPLHEGTIENGCVFCPWHDSAFSLSDGSVVTGPATRPQRVFEVRTRDGSIQIRSAPEHGSLRTNPVT